MTKVKTLPDYLRPGLDILSIGLNPSLPSVREGFYFANPRNRFWRALNASGLVDAELEPGIDAMQILFDDYAIGFTDVVKRPTAGGSELRAVDYRYWVPLLQRKLATCEPAIAWFHGKQAYANYLKYTTGNHTDIAWGEQPAARSSHVFVSPNPSPANAVFSLDDLVRSYQQLASLRDALAGAADS